jgi:hypothetical protein
VLVSYIMSSASIGRPSFLHCGQVGSSPVLRLEDPGSNLSLETNYPLSFFFLAVFSP